MGNEDESKDTAIITVKRNNDLKRWDFVVLTPTGNFQLGFYFTDEMSYNEFYCRRFFSHIMNNAIKFAQ